MAELTKILGQGGHIIDGMAQCIPNMSLPEPINDDGCHMASPGIIELKH